ncbi:MAG: EAL domain-containing protein [Spirochaetia bacterium]|nr:EAL domain-containing protein [Spirochaetia bacterium]
METNKLDRSKLDSLSDEIKNYIYFLEQYKTLVDESNIVSKTDPEGIITYVNKKFSEISGYSAYELIGKNHNIIRHPETPSRVFKTMWETISNKKTWHGMVKNRKKDGGYYIVEATIIPVIDLAGNITEYIAIRQDITRLVDQRRQIRKQTTDAMTGYANFNKLTEDIELSENKVLILVNIDMFNAIIDFYGESISNNVVKEVADKIYKIKEKGFRNFKLYKLVGDEYVLFSPEKMDTPELEETVQSLFYDIMKDSLVVMKNIEIHYAVSVGVYHGTDLSPLNKARIALKQARESKKGYYIYDEKLTKMHYRNFSDVMILKQAIIGNKIIPYYQPIVDMKTGEITKYESLVRLTQGENEIFLPREFLGTAKQSKLYPYITSAVIKNVLLVAENSAYEFSINLSVEDIVDRRINKMIIDSIRNYAGNRKNIIFEITESENIDDFEEVQDFINEIKKFECQIAIDDFGSGYSNFEYLARLDIDFVKVDGSLIRNMTRDNSIYKIVRVIMDFAREMKYKTVAEYTESEEIFNLVKKLGFDYCQGYYIGKPEPFELTSG